MPMVYIKCPITQDVVPTNYILADELKLSAHTRKIEIHCPFCNAIHSWDNQNGFFLKPGTAGTRIEGNIEF